ncbi:uncharacterized protein PFL1_05232 [Pseudozyma flocculosa PF-1]|uniref:GATA-type domain-containing protein n=1 Tax=Pseudozyma flocculosa PF-1 TaxID=1277687 RepID=A0A061H5N7_9BASI|nr:uncharacterized protein PFL1_05232 [Pseudozyma flocculosa PF-1]EPQ27310.1 hypothetical protein PFL1_05232 [Pseudozyma flocculosa PF-1]
MAASTSGNPTQGGFGRMAPKSPIAGRAKRSNSGSFIDHQMPRSHDAAAAAAEAARMGARDTPDLFVPSTLGEHLLETTYLGDVVKPLVRALVHARMVTAQRGQGEDEHAHFFADLERLRNELQLMPPFASPRAATIYHGGGGGGGGAIYDGGPLHGDMDHDMELAGEGPRKHPKLHTDSPMRPPSVSDRGLPGSQMMMPVSMDTMSAPTRKLAATKNRTCSNCAAPHDAKFRRGPNGPGTLCDRCGSRWKKYKESEAAMLNASGPDHSIDASRGVSRSQSGQASDSRSPPSPPSGGGGAVPTSGGSGGPGDRDRDSGDTATGDTATSRISNGRDGGGDGGGQTPQERQRLPHHLSSRQREELSPSPPLAAGRGAGTQERAGGAAANGDPASSSAAGTPHNGKREEARRREASSSPDQLED